MYKEEIKEKIKEILVRILEHECVEYDRITIDSSLIDDLGFTSLMFVDLTLGMEDAFSFGEFPIQEWIDEQVTLQERGFRIESLVKKCEMLFASP